MNFKLITTAALAALLGFAAPLKAENLPLKDSGDYPSVQLQPSTRQIREACIQNQAETLPNPFVDLQLEHWAFKSILTMYYCGLYRQSTSSQLTEGLLQRQDVSPTLE